MIESLQNAVEIERRHVREAEKLVARQEAILRELRLRRDRRLAELAQEVLAGLQESLKLASERLARLEHERSEKRPVPS
jgi:hypothetical protein